MKTTTIQLRCSESFKTDVERLAEAKSMSVAEYIRSLIIVELWKKSDAENYGG